MIKLNPEQIPGVGNPEADVMIINSYVSDKDDQNGVATLSKELLDFMNRAGLSLESVYYTNAIKTWAPKGTKYKVKDINAEKPILLQEIEEVDPKYILVLGAQALKATVGGAITTNNGLVIEDEKGRKYVPSYNPSIVYRDPGKAQFVNKALNTFLDLFEGKERTLPELDVRLIHNMVDLKKAFRFLKRKGWTDVSYDIETTGLDRFKEEITLLGFGNDKVQFIIPLEVKFSPLKGKRILKKRLVQEAIDQLNELENLVAGNGKFDNLFLQEHYRKKPVITFDTVLASHILDENTPNGVKENAILECGALDWDIDLNLKKGGIKTREAYKKYITYLGYDIYYEYQLFEVFKKRIHKDSALKNLYYHLYMPAIRAYEEIETNGVYIYQSQFKEVETYLKSQLAEIEGKLSKFKEGVNWASSQQVGKFLYEELGLPILERTPAGKPSTGEATLMQLRDQHEVVPLILEHRGVVIQISHFVEGWISRMHKGKLHPSFKMLTVTGRTSCKDPNLQQVPRDPKIRSLIGAPKGKTFIEADFSQAELRVATILSGDKEMTRIYNESDGDIHTNTFELVTGETISEDKYIKKEQRKKAKAINFGFLYGMGYKKFKIYARDQYGVDMTEEEAKVARDNFFKGYNALPAWHAKQRKLVKALGQVRSPIGRVRRLPDINSSDQGKRAEAERQSINAPVQGFGSDLTILGMIEVLQYAKYNTRKLKLDKERFKCVGTVHDATLFEVDDDYLVEFIEKVKAIMDKPRSLKKVFNFESPIPIVVDVSYGRSWGQGNEIDWNKDWKKEVKQYLKEKSNQE